MVDLSVFKPGTYESLWFLITVGKGKKAKQLIIGNVYKPPKAIFSEVMSIHSSILLKIKKDKLLNKCKLIVTSDFNIDISLSGVNDNVNEYLNSHFQFGLHPLITLPTRVTDTSSTVLDHIFVKPLPPDCISAVLQIRISDHFPTIFSDSTILTTLSGIPRKIRKINKDTIPAFVSLLKGINYFFDEEQPKESFDSFFNSIDAASDLALPELTIKGKKQKTLLAPWITKGILVSSRNKHKLFVTRKKKSL